MINKAISLLVFLGLAMWGAPHSVTGQQTGVPKELESAQQTAVQAVLSEFEATVEKGVDADGCGCVIVGVFKGNEMVWAKGFGLADVENKIPADAETIGRTGSITKSFTAVLVCQLAEQGVLQLDDPVEQHFPEIARLSNIPADAKPITYRMLASHTSGLEREPRYANRLARGPIEQWEEKVIDSIPNTSFKTSPLTEYSYSNIGFGILGLAGSRAAAQPYMSLVEEEIFRPLAMDSSTFIVQSDEMKARLAVGYVLNRRTGEISSEAPNRQHSGRGYKVPNGGIYSTVGDLAKFGAAMMGVSPTQILTEKSRTQIFTPQPPADSYGLGFKVQILEGMKIVGHSGSVAGYRADLRFDLDSEWGVASLATTTKFAPPSPRLLVDLVKAARSDR